jgi:nitrite reductase (NO-forming)
MGTKQFLVCAATSMFLLNSCGGNTADTSHNSGPADKPAAVSGEAVYKRTCITCHQANGEGIANTFPPLAKSDYLADREKTIGQVIKGKTGEIEVNGKKYNSVMPPQELSDEEIAAVLTFVYSNLGNSGGAVTPEEVKAVRSRL